MDDKYTLARMTVGGEHFEILVKPDPALQFKQGQEIDISKILVAEEIFTDSGKGTRPSEEKSSGGFLL